MHIERSGSQSHWTSVGSMLASSKRQHSVQAPMDEPARCTDALIQHQASLETQLQSAIGRKGTPCIQKAHIVTKPAKLVGRHMPQRAGSYNEHHWRTSCIWGTRHHNAFEEVAFPVLFLIRLLYFNQSMRACRKPLLIGLQPLDTFNRKRVCMMALYREERIDEAH